MLVLLIDSPFPIPRKFSSPVYCKTGASFLRSSNGCRHHLPHRFQPPAAPHGAPRSKLSTAARTTFEMAMVHEFGMAHVVSRRRWTIQPWTS